MKRIGFLVVLALLVTLTGCGGNSVAPQSTATDSTTLGVVFGKYDPSSGGYLMIPVSPNGVTACKMDDNINPFVYSPTTGDPGGVVESWDIVCPDGHTMHRTSEEFPFWMEYQGKYTFTANYMMSGKVYHPQAVLQVYSPVPP